MASIILIMKGNEMHYFSDLFDKVHVSDMSTVHIHALSICHSSSVGCLLAWSGPS